MSEKFPTEALEKIARWFDNVYNSAGSDAATIRAAIAAHAATEAELAEAKKERDEAKLRLQQTVAKVAENRLDGYRALGQRALDAEVAGQAERLKRQAAESALAQEREGHEETKRQRDAQTEIARATLRTAEELGAKLAATEAELVTANGQLEGTKRKLAIESRFRASEQNLRRTREAELEEARRANREAEAAFLAELEAKRAAESALAQEREGHEETKKLLDWHRKELEVARGAADSERARAEGLEMVIRVAEEHHESQRGAWSDNESDGEADLHVQYHTERRDVFRAALARPGDERKGG